MRSRGYSISLISVFGILIIAGGALTASAQQWSWPEKGQNLKVLPEGTGGQKLGDTMKGFTRALGVRCEHCHVEGGGDLSTFDFVSDEKETKKAARIMMRMVRTINDDFISTLGDDSPVHVSCETCHHGKSKPERIEDILHEAYESGGVDVLRSKYIQLRAQYYGSYSYDFSESMLLAVVQSIPAAKQDDAIAVLQLNLEMYPQSWRSWHFLGEVNLLKKDKANAIDAFRKSLEMNPNNPAAAKRLEELGASESPGD